MFDTGWPPCTEAEDAFLVFGDRVRTGHGWRKEQLDFLERFFSA